MFLYSHWLSIPLATRNTLAQALGIAKTGSIEVHDNRVAKDGYAIIDVENGVTVSNLQGYTGSSDTDLNILWMLSVDKAEGREPVAPESLPVEEPVIPAESVTAPTPEVAPDEPVAEPTPEVASEPVEEPTPEVAPEDPQVPAVEKKIRKSKKDAGQA